MSTARSEIRALEVFDRLPPGHTMHLVRDIRHAPHLRPGEFAVIDTTDREISLGELYLIEQSHGPIIWQVILPKGLWAPRTAEEEERQACRPCVMLMPLAPPRTLPSGEIDWRYPVHTADGPIYRDALEPNILGRVVGIYQGPEVGATASRVLRHG